MKRFLVVLTVVALAGSIVASNASAQCQGGAGAQTGLASVSCSGIPAWNPTGSYVVGSQVVYSNCMYRANQAFTSNSSWCPGCAGVYLYGNGSACPTAGCNYGAQGPCSGGTPTATPTGATATPTTSVSATPTNTPTATATPTSGGGSGIGAIVSSAQFDQIWPPGIRSATYTHADFVTAANNYYPALCGTGDSLMQRRECAAYFGNKTQETGTGQFDKELYCQPGGGGYGTPPCDYCDTGNAPCGACASGQKYWGRHSIQLSWNYNYCNGGNAIGINLHADPNQIFANKVTGWRAANWYWMTQLGPVVTNWPMESAHTAMVTAGSSGNHFFGGTIRAINGALECFQGDPRQTNRINYYATARNILGAGASVGRDTCYP